MPKLKTWEKVNDREGNAGENKKSMNEKNEIHCTKTFVWRCTVIELFLRVE